MRPSVLPTLNPYRQLGLRSGFRLRTQQFKALFVKNYILLWRNKISLFTQLLSPVFFLFLLFAVTKWSEILKRGDVSYDPVVVTSLPILPCEAKFYAVLPCLDFIWSGNGSAKITYIVHQIMANNRGRPIPPSKVRSFKTTNEVDEWFLSNPLRCPGALHFKEMNATIISYGIQTNSTQVGKRHKYEDATFKFQIPLQLAAEREIARSLIGDSEFSWEVGFKKFPQPGSSANLSFTLTFLASAQPLFLLAIGMFPFFFQISSLVTEKELKLRQAMSTMCLYDSVYWFSWLTSETTFALPLSLITVLYGKMFRLHLFVGNGFLILFSVFFLFRISMIGFAFMLSTVIQEASSCATMGFLIFTITFVTQIFSFQGYPYSVEGTSAISGISWSLFPPTLLSKSLGILQEAADRGGISWSRISLCPPSFDSKATCAVTMTLSGIFISYIAAFFLWFVMAIYLDNIIPNPSGVRKSIFYFLNLGYWTGKGGNEIKEGGIFSFLRPIPQVEHQRPCDEDVLEEENTIRRQVHHDLIDPNVVQLRGLVKTYPGKIKIGFCKCKKKSHTHAVKGAWLNMHKDQLFCLLGPNGAGKTTMINCLTGICPATSGDALVYGHSIRSSIGMSNIRKLTGVCLQFDVLWDAFSAEEHLYLFANIKGIPTSLIKSAVDDVLADVGLTYAARGRVSGYSGEMKRRLSVAIALIGDPMLVILDEPTNGMDPITQRRIWKIIDNVKKGRAVILTTDSTDSVEEAEILSDRIGIVAKGTLHRLGNSDQLKWNFRSALIANVSFSETNTDAAKSCRRRALTNFFKAHLNLVPKEETECYVSYIIPRKKKNKLKKFFIDLKEKREEFGISDIQVNTATLEDISLNAAMTSEREGPQSPYM